MYQEVLIFFLYGFSESNLANNVHNTKPITIYEVVFAFFSLFSFIRPTFKTMGFTLYLNMYMSSYPKFSQRTSNLKVLFVSRTLPPEIFSLLFAKTNIRLPLPQ